MELVVEEQVGGEWSIEEDKHIDMVLASEGGIFTAAIYDVWR